MRMRSSSQRMALGLVALLVASLAAGCVFWSKAEPESAFARPAVSAGPAARHRDAVPEPSPATRGGRRLWSAVAEPAKAAAQAERERRQAGAKTPSTAEARVAAAEFVPPAPGTLPSVAEPGEEEAAASRPSLILPVAVVLAFGLLGLWLSRRQTSA